MATWGLHLRLAEAILKRGYNLDEAMFAVGNIGPDCGLPNEDWSAFDPPSEVSHWSTKGKSGIQSEKFYEAYLRDDLGNHQEKSFLIGYYVHLLTDLAFTKLFKGMKETNPLYAPLDEDPKFIWTIKEDWYDLDHLYFRDNPQSLFHKVFQHVKEVPNYLDYYPEGAVERQVQNITAYYQNPSDNLDRTYIYLTSEVMDRFVRETVGGICEDLESKGLVFL